MKDQMQSMLDMMQATSADPSSPSQDHPRAGRTLSLEYAEGSSPKTMNHTTTPAFVVEPAAGKFLVSTVNPVPETPTEQFCRCGDWVNCTTMRDPKTGKMGPNPVHLLRDTAKKAKTSTVLPEVESTQGGGWKDTIKNYEEREDADRSFVILTNAKKVKKKGDERFVQVVQGEVEVTSKIYAVVDVDTKAGVFEADVVLMLDWFDPDLQNGKFVEGESWAPKVLTQPITQTAQTTPTNFSLRSLAGTLRQQGGGGHRRARRRLLVRAAHQRLHQRDGQDHDAHAGQVQGNVRRQELPLRRPHAAHHPQVALREDRPGQLEARRAQGERASWARASWACERRQS
jgi:hypothetical protein